MTRIEVRATDGTVLPGIPTPRLMQAGGGEAYFVVSERCRVCKGYRQGPQHYAPGGLTPSRWHSFEATEVGLWYLHEEPRYTSLDGEYTRVRVVSVEEPLPE